MMQKHWVEMSRQVGFREPESAPHKSQVFPTHSYKFKRQCRVNKGRGDFLEDDHQGMIGMRASWQPPGWTEVC